MIAAILLPLYLYGFRWHVLQHRNYVLQRRNYEH